ncbi:transcription factor IIA, alpha/beta subunit [Basidiobolus meristosporus CBS 931.73]|uniref:Transcription initiation factor IIA large subunit n=1 Tax=Basidiobolus meristosporus CBS 931.73 TaxID=1314790 RepID=A0A1Y1Y639_9FUNG|nr:transcription factor IIA, alpha/beta subunit [Basidiobolus meristosporus CBS 931.73]|eukprot:ORX93166.1 transcription factor IIA, alpha/beta subunit [Basidiobolus meristosporus CBS 931.73]
MSNSIVAGVYRHVIDEVISTVQKDFEDMGVDESILQELQRSWETKIANARVANFVVSDPQVTEGYTNAYYDESGNPVQYADQYPHAPAPTEAQEYAYAEQYQQQQPHGVAAANLATLASASSALKQENGVGAPQSYMPPRNDDQVQLPQPTQATASYYNTIMLPTGSNGDPKSNHNIPQTDGPADMSTQEIDAMIATRALAKHARKIPQVDGEDDDDDEDAEGEEEGDEAEPVVDSEDAINSDLDDTDDDDRGEDGGEEMEHIVLCQYDKVTRTKNKWKCVLKDGIMLVNGKDYLFHKVNGDFEW